MLRTTLNAAALSVALACPAALAGDLTPPPGPVEATMMRLDEIRSSTPISSLPGAPDAVHVITQPGAYHMTEDINPGLGQHGIKIDLDGLPPGEPPCVCISMDGYTIRASAGSLDGIHYTDNVGHRELIVINGGSGSIGGTGGDGIRLANADGVEISNLNLTGGGGEGINADNNQRVTYYKYKLTRCFVRSWSSDGGSATGYADVEINDCSFFDNGGNGLTILPASAVAASGAATGSVRISNTSSNGNGGDGVSIVPQAGGTYTFDLIVVDANANTTNGITVDTSAASVQVNGNFTDVKTIANAGNGVRENYAGVGATNDVLSWSWRRVEASSNGSHGVDCALQECSISKMMDRCSASDNGGDGVRVTKGLTQSCTLDMEKFTRARNGGSGLHVLPGPGASANDYCRISMTGCVDTGNLVDGVRLAWTPAGGPFEFTSRRCSMSSNIGNGLFMQNCDGDNKDNDCNSNGGRGTVATGSVGRFEGCSFSNNGSHGLESDDSSCWIRVCQFNANGGDGISFLSPAGARSLEVIRCRAESNTGSGIASTNPSTIAKPIRCIDTTCSANGADGITLVDAAARVEGCTLSDNIGNGATSTTALATCCRADQYNRNHPFRNGGSGLLIGGATGATITGNATSANVEYGIWCQSTVTQSSIVDNNCNADGGAIRVDGQLNVVCRNNATAGVLGGITVGPNNAVGFGADITNVDTNTNPAANVTR